MRVIAVSLSLLSAGLLAVGCGSSDSGSGSGGATTAPAASASTTSTIAKIRRPPSSALSSAHVDKAAPGATVVTAEVSNTSTYELRFENSTAPTIKNLVFLKPVQSVPAGGSMVVAWQVLTPSQPSTITIPWTVKNGSKTIGDLTWNVSISCPDVSHGICLNTKASTSTGGDAPKVDEDASVSAKGNTVDAELRVE